MIGRLLEGLLSISENRLFSGIRMVKLTMFFALLIMHITKSKSSLKFNREWFMRLCGFLLGKSCRYLHINWTFSYLI